MAKLILTGSSLNVENVAEVAYLTSNEIKVFLSDETAKQIETSFETLNTKLKNGDIMYGVNTGFGSLHSTVISNDKCSQLSRNILLSHAVGVGEYLPREVVRAAILIRANSLSKGKSGVQRKTIDLLLEMLNNDITPYIPCQGSLACSGDLCLLSHLGLCISEPLPGELEPADTQELVNYKGQTMKAKEAFKLIGVENRVILGPKEGLAITNGSTFTAGYLCLMIAKSLQIFNNGVDALSLTLEALLGCPDAFNAEIHNLRPHPGQKLVAQLVRDRTKNSKWIGSTTRVQDSYSLRCAPQVMGVLYDEITNAQKVLNIEINSVCDNPIITSNKVISGGNFHGEYLANTADNLKKTLSEFGAISERRLAKLVDPNHNNGLPSMLNDNPGLNSGLMITQYTAAALALDNQKLANPDSTLSLPTCSNQEDHNSNGFNAVRHLHSIVKNVEKIIALEMFASVKGIHLRTKLDKNELSDYNKNLLRKLENSVTNSQNDYYLKKDIDALVKQIFPENSTYFIDYKNVEDDSKAEMDVIPPSGTKDYHPHEMRIRQQLMKIIIDVFETFGAETIQTPVFEFKDLLLSKYGDQQKLVYELSDQGGADLCLRYDLTVPLARYIATHGKYKMKRYCIDRVYRRDNPSMKQGRFREFYQCDYDVTGKYDVMVADAEVVTCVSTILTKLNTGALRDLNLDFTIKINDKRFLDFVILKKCGIPQDKLMTTCSSIDKLDKEPWSKIQMELLDKGISKDALIVLENFTKIRGTPMETLDLLVSNLQGDNYSDISSVVEEWRLLLSYLQNYNVLNTCTFDFSLARGLSYYTGLILEGILLKDGTPIPDGSSIAGGGRYDNLINMFAKSQSVPAVGASIGIERIFAYMERLLKEKNSKEESKSNFNISSADFYVAMVTSNTELVPELRKACMECSSIVRKEGARCEMSYLSNQSFKDIINEAVNNHIPHVIILAENEWKDRNIILKNVVEKKQFVINIKDLAKNVVNIKYKDSPY
jgi:histidine ammonia-lyase